MLKTRRTCNVYCLPEIDVYLFLIFLSLFLL